MHGVMERPCCLLILHTVTKRQSCTGLFCSMLHSGKDCKLAESRTIEVARGQDLYFKTLLRSVI